MSHTIKHESIWSPQSVLKRFDNIQNLFLFFKKTLYKSILDKVIFNMMENIHIKLGTKIECLLSHPLFKLKSLVSVLRESNV